MPEKLDESIPRLEALVKAEQFPTITVDILKALRNEGYFAVGVIAAIFDENYRILVLEHSGSDKSEDGDLGFLAETTKLFRPSDGRQVLVEQPLETLQRALAEELGVGEPFALDLYAQPNATWFPHSWPVGKDYDDQFAHAICPVIFMKNGDKFLSQASPRGEVRAASFMTVDEIFGANNVRRGTHNLLAAVTKHVLDAEEEAPVYLEVPVSRFSDANLDCVDARLQQIEL